MALAAFSVAVAVARRSGRLQVLARWKAGVGTAGAFASFAAVAEVAIGRA